jgi:hypothetical protein
MGHGIYNFEAHARATQARAAAAPAQLFTQRTCDPAMVPFGATREARDSADHPQSVPIIFALDVSGSMGDIPRALATRTLPGFMRCVTGFLPDAQLLFAAVGNVYGDSSPFQIGQFESDEARIDGWLERLHLEGGGGGLGESYDLALYFAARRTRTDAWERRQQRGYLFLTGDEPFFVELQTGTVKQVFGDPLDAALPVEQLMAEVCERWHPFILIPDAARAAAFQTGGAWRILLHSRCVVLARPDDVAIACALLVGITEGQLPDVAALETTAKAHLGPDEATQERVAGLVSAVTPYLEALRAGPIAPPGVPGRQRVEGVKG